MLELPFLEGLKLLKCTKKKHLIERYLNNGLKVLFGHFSLLFCVIQLYIPFHFSILWDFAQTAEEFAFKSIQDVLEENEELKAEVKYLRDVVETNITEIIRVLDEQRRDITDLRIEQGKTSETVEELEVKTQSNTDNIATNSEQIEVNTYNIQENSNS